MSAEPIPHPTNETLQHRLRPGILAHLAKVGALFAIYFSTAKLGLLMDAVGGFATTVWPPTGISLAALFLFGYRLWPGVALGAFLVNVSAGAPFLAAAGMAAGNTLEALLGTYLLRRFAGFRGSLDRISCVIGLVVFAAGLSTAVSATIGVTSGWLGGVIPSAAWGKAWLTWWLGDAMGDLVLAPLLFIWAMEPRVDLSPRRLLEAGALLVSLVIASLLVFGVLITPRQTIFLQPYVLFPFWIWAALRFCQHGTATATFVVVTIAIWRTAQGAGPFAMGTVNESLLFLQAFMGVAAVTMLVLAADVSERRRVEVDLRKAHEELERRVERRTAQLSEANRIHQAEIAERRRAEEEARLLNAQLEAAYKALETFSYSVSHDLRAPLRAMQGFAQALQEDYGDHLDPTGRDYARRVLDSARRMDGMIQDLLAYSRISSFDLLLKPLDFRSVLSEVMVDLEAEVRERRAQVIVEDGLPQVVGNRAALSQVLTNLLTNALKFVAPGAEPRVRIRGEDRGQRLRVWIEDNGIGIAPEHQERIFRVFERLHGIETYPGTGIGLAIVRKGMERMGGWAGVESQPGEGSRFWIEVVKPQEAP